MLINTEINTTYLFEQYKIAIETADKTTDRRYQFNGFIITIATVLLGFSGFSDVNDVANFIIPIFGISLCLVWQKQLANANKLVWIKYKTVKELENLLNIHPSYILPILP